MKLCKLLVLTGAVFLIACGGEEDNQSTTQGGANTIATVDGQPITITDRTLYLQERKQQGQTSDLKEVTEELINLKVIVINAEKQELHEREDIKAELQRQRDGLLANIYIQQHMQKIEISDDDLAKEYEAQLTRIPSTEYNASHILSKTEEAALAVLKRLKNGDEFGRVASEESTGPSAENGGELGWFRLESMVPEFSAAVTKLKKGKYTEKPLKTNFGWHVIRLTDTRSVARPSFEDVKTQLRTIVMNNHLSDFVQKLRADSEIEIK